MAQRDAFILERVREWRMEDVTGGYDMAQRWAEVVAGESWFAQAVLCPYRGARGAGSP